MANGMNNQMYHKQQAQRRYSPRRGMKSANNQQQERLSPSSSIGSNTDLVDISNGGGGSGTKPKKSTSTSSGLKSLGRIFGSQRKKSLEKK
jgi:hypothetical protein